MREQMLLSAAPAKGARGQGEAGDQMELAFFLLFAGIMATYESIEGILYNPYSLIASGIWSSPLVMLLASMIAAMIPIVLIEGAVYKYALRTDWKKAMKISLVINAAGLVAVIIAIIPPLILGG